MRECRAFDLFSLSTQRVIDADGVLTVPGVIAKAANVQEYRASELGLDGDPNRIVKLYRPREEVAKSAASFAKKPITNNHPPDKWITPKNWDRFAVGDSDASVDMQGDDMVTTLIFRKQAAIDALASGKAGLSNGYKFRLDDSKTTTPEGLAVDGWMTDIRGNHIALVDRGRGGPGCVVADEQDPAKDKHMATRITKIGKHSCELELSAADAAEAQNTEIEKMAADQKAAVQMATDAEKRAVDAETQVAAHLEKIAALDKEIAALRAAPPAPTDEAIEKAAEVRQAVIADAATLAPDLAPKGKTTEAIRREALTTASAKRADVKGVVDSVIGSEMDKADAGKVEAAFLAAVSIVRAGKTAADNSLGAEMLRAGTGSETTATDSTKSTKANDGSEGLSGHALYVHNLTHRARATA
jgi:hypothetical protein